MIYKFGSISLLVGSLTLVACTEHMPDAMEPLAVALKPSAQEIHQRALVLDAHADIEIPGKQTKNSPR